MIEEEAVFGKNEFHSIGTTFICIIIKISIQISTNRAKIFLEKIKISLAVKDSKYLFYNYFERVNPV